MQCEPAVVAEAIKHACTRTEAADGLAIHALVQEVPRLLSGKQIDRELESAVCNCNDSCGATDDALPQRKLIKGAQRCLVAFDDRNGMEEFFQDITDHRQAGIHAEGEGLQDDVVVESIDDQPGEEICFAMDQPVDGAAGKELCAQSQRLFETLTEERRIDLDRDTGEQADRDERMWMVYPDTERFASRVADLDDVPRGRLAMGLADLITEYPWMSGENATILVLAKQDRSGG